VCPIVSEGCSHAYCFLHCCLSVIFSWSYFQSLIFFLLLYLACWWSFLLWFLFNLFHFHSQHFSFFSLLESQVPLFNCSFMLMTFLSRSWKTFLISFISVLILFLVIDHFENILNSLPAFQTFWYLWIWLLRCYELLKESYCLDCSYYLCSSIVICTSVNYLIHYHSQEREQTAVVKLIIPK
jgi:hypothetical protein